MTALASPLRAALDLRRAARSFARDRAVFTLAAGTLALALGATAAIFALADAVVLRPLPFPEPERLVVAWQSKANEGGELWRVTPADYAGWRDGARAFASLAAFGASEAILTGHGEPALLRGGRATREYLATLGVEPLLGRWFSAEESAADAPVVVLGAALWRERFASDPAIVGRALDLAGKPRTVIGVLPPGLYPSWPLNGPRLHFDAGHHDFWVPLPDRELARRGAHVLGVVGRLRPAATLADARRDLETVAARLAAEHEVDGGQTAVVRPLAEEVQGNARPALLLLLGAAGLLLAIAGANVTGLLAARAVARRQEVAVRRALGADRAALAGPFAAEALLLVATAGALAWPVAALGRAALVRLAPAEIPRLGAAALDPRVLALLVVLGLALALVFALVPMTAGVAGAFSSAGLRQAGRGGGAGSGRSRARSALVVAQVALALMVAVAAALLSRTFAHLERLELGFAPERTLVADLSLPAYRYDEPGRVDRFFESLLAELRARPGIVAATIAYDTPVESNWTTGFDVVGGTEDPTRPWTSELRFVGADYFTELRIPVVAGRGVEASDDAGHPPAAWINRAFARRFFAGEDPLGREIDNSTGTWEWGPSAPTRFTIAGVVGDVRSPGLGSRVAPALYLAARQLPQREMKLLVRGERESDEVLAEIRAAVARLDAEQPIGRVGSIAGEIDRAVAQPRLSFLLMAAFALLSVMLATVGVYALLSQWVGARARELGTRAALGGTPAQIRALVLGRSARLALAGAALGGAGSLALSSLLASQLFGVSATDPWTLGAVAATLVGVATLAALPPARRATRVDPAIVLRES